MSNHVFRSAGQALHVSWLMEILPVTQRVATQVLIDSIREQLGKVERRIESTINLGGMSPLEFRAQCAMVRAASRDHLTQPEYDAVRCRYGHQTSKAEGVMSLSDYLAPMVGLDHDWALRALLWSMYHRGGQRAADRWSIRRISEETGITTKRLRTAADKARAVAEALDRRAEGNLQDHFYRTGLVPADEAMAA